MPMYRMKRPRGTACSGFTLKRNPPASSPRKLTGSRKAFHRGGKEMEERDETIQGPVRDEREEDADGRAQSGLERRAQKG
ncbi:hypothetical protein AAFF_G00433830 [Aldrovandia affinis]|uniref:Uncharacterized protein n=1 Tax=Aldrovandia affinis TaxID=143900 RepID=A0AAD7VYD3_9TELE|nr:hypothetical protein AAFF_G00433830 [Aldrovandia affinis]